MLIASTHKRLRLMKIKGSIFFSLLALCIFGAAFYYPSGNNEEKESVLMQNVLTTLNRYHYQPQDIDDDFSERVMEIYLENIDGARRYLTQSDVDQLMTYKTKLDDQAREGKFEFFNLSLELLKEGLKKSEAYFKEFINEPFDFAKDETIEFDPDKRGYAKGDAELQEYWRKYIKYQVMIRFEDKLERQKKLLAKKSESSSESEEGESEGDKIKTEAELEKEARDQVKEIFDRLFNIESKKKRANYLDAYINALTEIYDPHTQYFSPIEKEEFDIRLSGQYEGIGARLIQEGDYVKVSEVIPGGPAWKGKELEKNDIILKVAQGDEEPKDMYGLATMDVVQYIRGKKETEVRLTVRKVDGSEAVISMIRDIIIMEESFAKSLILDGSVEGERVGYISLPNFYANFNNRNEGRFCSDDVATEIAKLKAENVDGIILDLRSNGGGSLEEVVKMSGFFIEEGPIVQANYRGKSPRIHSDSDKSVLWDGPLVVMVNSFSASASEILAAALQDYDRAIVVGSNSTYGKGTVQMFLDLDRTVRGWENFKPFGQVKITMQKYYRVNGGSVQLRGVTPDIIFPDNFYYIKTGEKEQESAMAWTEIDPVDYEQSAFVINNRDEIIRNSNSRISENEAFQKIMENARRLKDQRDETEYTLNLEDYGEYELNLEKESEAFNKLFKKEVNKGISNPSPDAAAIKLDETKQARNEDWIKSVSKDIYLNETINVIHDLIRKGQEKE